MKRWIWLSVFLMLFGIASLACGSEEAPTKVPVPSGEATPLGRNLRGGTVEAGTPIAKAGTPDAQPIPSQIGDCVIEPNTDCPGADLRGAGLGFRAGGRG